MKTQEELREEIIAKVRMEMSKDWDVSRQTNRVANQFERFLKENCILAEGERDIYTTTLTQIYVLFGMYLEVGSSHYDYIASNVTRALSDYQIRLTSDKKESVLSELREGISESAINPQRELDNLAKALIV